MLAGTLHIVVAFDWGDEIDLGRVRQLVPAQFHALPRRRRTPSSMAYQPAPLLLTLVPVEVDLPQLGVVQAAAAATVFDFAAVSVALRIPFKLEDEQLRQIAGWLGDPTTVVQRVQAAVRPLYEQLKPALRDPKWDLQFSEEYVVFELPPPNNLPPPAQLLDAAQPCGAWLAGLVRLESGPLSSQEISEALRLHISYHPDDLLVADWTAAVLIDSDCEETLEAIEFTNLQLLEFRQIDSQLDASLAAAYRLVHPTTQSWLPFWRTHTRPLRWLGELKVEANGLFERTGNALKLVGDAYLARVYRLLAARFCAGHVATQHRAQLARRGRRLPHCGRSSIGVSGGIAGDTGCVADHDRIVTCLFAQVGPACRAGPLTARTRLLFWNRRSLRFMKIIPLGEAKARLSYYSRLCHREPVIVTVKGVPAFQLAPLEEDDDLIDRLLEHNPKFQDYLEGCLRSRSVSSADALRKLK